MDDLGLLETVDFFGESVVIAVADASDRRLDACFGQALGLFDRQVLAATVGVMDKATAIERATVVRGLF
jgi:hypothetical protein